MMHDATTVEALFPRRALAREEGPLYRQLAEILRRPIAEGRLAVGGELPKEARLAEHFGVSLITVRQALRDLEGDGLIRKRSAKPAIVTAREAKGQPAFPFANFADMAAFTRDARLEVGSFAPEASPMFAARLGVPAGRDGFCLRALLVGGSERRAEITTYFPPEFGRRLQREDFTDVLIFRTVQRKLDLRLTVAHVTIRAEVADPALAAALAVTPDSPVVTSEMLYQAEDGSNVEFTVARHPAHLFSVTYDAPNDLG